MDERRTARRAEDGTALADSDADLKTIIGRILYLRKEKTYYTPLKMIRTITMDVARGAIVSRVAEPGLSVSALSLKVGKNHAYFQQFIKRGCAKPQA